MSGCFEPKQGRWQGEASTPCIKTDLEDMIPRRIRWPVGKQTVTCRDFVWGSDMPSAEGSKHLDGRWIASTPCIKNRPWGYDPPMNQMACGKANSHMHRRYLWKTGIWTGESASMTGWWWGLIPGREGSRISKSGHHVSAKENSGNQSTIFLSIF